MLTQTLETLSLIDLMAIITTKVEDEAVEFNQLSKMYDDLLTNFELQKQHVTYLEQNLLSFGATIDKKNAQHQTTENERLKLKGQLATTQTELKALKALGDINSVNRRLKEQKAKNVLASAGLEKLKKDRNAWVKERENYEGRLRSLEDFPLFSSKEKETITLHGQKLTLIFGEVELQRVALKYWNPCGIGRLVTLNEGKLSLADAGLENFEDTVGMSQEMVDFCVGWFTENVVTKGKTQNLIVKSKRAS